MEPTVADPLTHPGPCIMLGLDRAGGAVPSTPMGERTATTVDPEALADAILADQPAAQARTTSSTRKHLQGLSPELAERLEAGGACGKPRGSSD